MQIINTKDHLLLVGDKLRNHPNWRGYVYKSNDGIYHHKFPLLSKALDEALLILGYYPLDALHTLDIPLLPDPFVDIMSDTNKIFTMDSIRIALKLGWLEGFDNRMKISSKSREEWENDIIKTLCVENLPKTFEPEFERGRGATLKMVECGDKSVLVGTYKY